MTNTNPIKLTHDDAADISALLVGHRVVGADIDTQTLTLDDQTQIQVEPNEGCGGCSAGHYYLDHLATVDNIITSVKVTSDDLQGGDDPQRYSIFVFCDNEQINLLQVDGDDGNGYYGTGYKLIVTLPAQAARAAQDAS